MTSREAYVSGLASCHGAAEVQTRLNGDYYFIGLERGKKTLLAWGNGMVLG